MRDHGATVVAVPDANRAALRATAGIPESAAGCHTALVSGYAIEGHVPIEAIAKLLRERPNAVGLALPGMPADAPGMGGNAKTWAALDVLLVQRDGTLTPFEY